MILGLSHWTYRYDRFVTFTNFNKTQKP